MANEKVTEGLGAAAPRTPRETPRLDLNGMADAIRKGDDPLTVLQIAVGFTRSAALLEAAEIADEEAAEYARSSKALDDAGRYDAGTKDTYAALS